MHRKECIIENFVVCVQNAFIYEVVVTKLQAADGREPKNLVSKFYKLFSGIHAIKIIEIAMGRKLSGEWKNSNNPRRITSLIGSAIEKVTKRFASFFHKIRSNLNFWYDIEYLSWTQFELMCEQSIVGVTGSF